MKIIRRYSNVAEAGFAQSLLEAAGIDATLADDHAATLGPQFVPWGARLEVPDTDAQRALEILDRQVGLDTLPPGVTPHASALMTPDATTPILTEIQRLRISNQIASICCILLLIVAIIYIPAQLRPLPTRRQTPQPERDSWETVNIAIERLEYEKAAEIAKRIVTKYPTDYYGYAYLGNIAVATGRIQDAQGYYARACELLPTEENEKKLRAIRKRLESESSKQPSSFK